MPRRYRGALSAATLLASTTLAQRAGAVEGEHHLGVGAGPAVLVIHGKATPDVGAGVAAHYTYGLTDAFNLMAEGGWSLVALGERAQSPQTPATRPAWVAHAGAGLGYV